MIIGEKRSRSTEIRERQAVQGNALTRANGASTRSPLCAVKGGYTDEIVLASAPTYEGILAVLERDICAAEFDVVLSEDIIEVVRGLELSVLVVNGQVVAVAGAKAKRSADGQIGDGPIRDRKLRAMCCWDAAPGPRPEG